MARRTRSVWVMVAGVLAAAAALAVAGWEDLHPLRKVVGAALTPLGLIWLLLAALAAMLWRRRQRRLAAVAGAGWLVLSLAGNPQVAAWQLALLEGPFSSFRPPAQGSLDALLVLGGGVAMSSSGRVTLGGAADRVIWPVQLYRQDVAGTLVSSGPILPAGSSPARPATLPQPASYPDAVAGLWVSLGVAPEHIVRLPGPRTTREEIDAYRGLVDQRGWRRVGLVTSAWHMRRALRHCRRVGLQVHPLPCDVRGDPPRWRWRHLIPSASALEASAVASSEALALLGGL